LTRWRSTRRSISQARREHHRAGDDEGSRLATTLLSMPATEPLRKARHGQRREQHHRALREVEDARRP
jgi:hypothetical protein